MDSVYVDPSDASLSPEDLQRKNLINGPGDIEWRFVHPDRRRR